MGMGRQTISRGYAVDVGVVELTTKNENGKKIVVLDGNQKLWTDDDGIGCVGVIPFLIDESVLEALQNWSKIGHYLQYNLRVPESNAYFVIPNKTINALKDRQL